MYALSFLKEGKRSNLDRDYSDDDNEVIGQVVHNTAEGMPIRLVDVDNDDKEKGDEIIILRRHPSRTPEINLSRRNIVWLFHRPRPPALSVEFDDDGCKLS